MEININPYIFSYMETSNPISVISLETFSLSTAETLIKANLCYPSLYNLNSVISLI